MKDIKLTKKELEDIKSTLREMVSERYSFDDISEEIENDYRYIDSFKNEDKNLYRDLIDFLFSIKCDLSEMELYEYSSILDPKSFYKWDKYDEKEQSEFKNLLIKEYGLDKTDFE
tara:strand:+ start:1214 stop:1558 length:345 start_codon:yes stop_codon:yes gene_type:complete